jgi:ribosomal protein L11 methyltransferase
MVYHVLFRVKTDSFVDEALLELSPVLTDPYVLEDVETGAVQVGGYALSSLSPSLWRTVDLISCSPADAIDWEGEWAQFSPHYQEGLVRMPLRGGTLLLEPGPGFGDCSHPTTLLVLDLMAPYVAGCAVIDIGCGSGVLSLAAALLGARSVQGIDIEEEALAHARRNALLNQIPIPVVFSRALESSPAGELLIVMNMIVSQQEVAWAALPCLHGRSSRLITSGVLETERSQYLALADSWGFELVGEQSSEGWMAFVLNKISM